jgi:hypothetical protein
MQKVAEATASKRFQIFVVPKEPTLPQAFPV